MATQMSRDSFYLVIPVAIATILVATSVKKGGKVLPPMLPVCAKLGLDRLVTGPMLDEGDSG